MENKNRDKDKMRKIAEIEKQIWKVYDILKKEGLGVEDSHLLLLFLSLYKDGQLEEFLDQMDDSESDNNQIVGEAATQYSSLQKNYLHIVPSQIQFSELSKHHIAEQFSQVNKEDLSESYDSLFESVLHQITTSQGRVGGESMQPDKLTRFIANLIDLPKGAKVYNPFAGYGSYAFYLNEEYEYFGQELNPKTYTLGKLRLKAHNRLANTTYLCEDSIVNWPEETEKFDLIVSTPPFGMRLNKAQSSANSRIRRVEHFLIEKGVSSLNEKGKLITLLPQTILSSGGQEQRLRKELIEKDLIDTIISLPAGLLSNTGIPLAILVIDKDKKMPGGVCLVNADKFIDDKNLKNRQLNDKELSKLIKTTTQDSDSIRFVDNKQIEAFDYNLSVPRYFIDVEGTKLRDILTPIKGERSNLPDTGKFIRIRDLSDDKLNFKLDVSGIEEHEFGKQRVRLINESCLLIAALWKASKPTIFEFEDTPIYVSSDILSFKINDQLVNPAYLINELHANYVAKQFNSYATGGVIPRIRQKDLLEIVIKLPSLEVQRAKVEGISELSNKIEHLIKERDAFEYGETINQFNEFASLKHTLGRPRTNILAWTDNIIAFINDNEKEFESLNQSFKDFYEVDLLFALKEIKEDVNFMTKLLEKGEDGFRIEAYKTKFTSLSEIKGLIKNLSNNGLNFKIKKDLLVDITKKEELKSRGIEANKELLKILIDNVLTNANKHAFDDDSKGNEVFFELKEVDGFLLFEIRNNGKPFPRNYNREKFIARYSTADFRRGTGQGGYDIHRIATKFKNPDWKLLLNEDPIYMVKFEFQFPIINSK